MGDLKNEDTSYPASLDTRTLIADSTDDVVAAHVNGLASAIIALETELGVNPAGSVTDIVTRLAVNLHDDGGVLRGTSFPVSPPLKLHLFWRTDLKQLYMYDTSIAQYQRVDATNVHASLAALDADDHTQYVHNTTARTITAQHTFNPGSALPPFILHANAQGQKVIGLDAETVDGKNPGSASGIATLNGSSLVVEDPANATATKTAGKICKWGTSEAFECSVLSATAVSGTTITGSSTVQGTKLISTVATGTAPLTVASTTGVANLTASSIIASYYDGSSSTNTATVDLGSVTAGDVFIVSMMAQMTSSTSGLHGMGITKSSGTGSCLFFTGNTGTAIQSYASAGSIVLNFSYSNIVVVTVSGTLVLKSYDTGSPGTPTGYINKIRAVFLNKQ